MVLNQPAVYIHVFAPRPLQNGPRSEQVVMECPTVTS
jgi:hypothetical protein